MGQKSNEIRQLIVNEVQNGVKYREIASKFDISLAGIHKIMKKFKTQKTVERKKGSGKSRKTTPQEDRSIRRIALNNPLISSQSIVSELNLSVSRHTVINRLNEFNIRSSFRLKKPLLRRQNIIKRLEFAKKYVNMPLSFWKRVIWTDESKFELKNQKRRKRTWIPKGKQLQSKYTQATVKHGGGSLLVWGCFSWKGVGKIVKIDGIMTGQTYVNILQENLGPSVRKMKMGRYIFQQDNDPKHTSKVAKAYFEKRGFEMLEWPPQSPDLNPIEHLWMILDDRIPIHTRSNMAQFWEGVQEAWDNIPIDTSHNLVESMPRRLQKVIENKGGHTKY